MPACLPDPPAVLPLDSAREAFVRPADGLYLDTAAHGPRLRAVQAAAQRALDDGTRPWSARWDEWAAQVERVRTLVARLFDGDADGVALVPSVAHGLATAARNLPLACGEAVLVLDDAFPSSLLTWQQRCGEVGAHLRAVRRGTDGTAAVLDALARDPAPRIVALEHAHWHDGALLDMDEIATAVHARGASLVLDLSQSLGALPAAIERWQPAFAVAVGYKWLLGPGALCPLWVAPHWRAQGRPLDPHWTAYEARVDWSFSAGRLSVPLPGARRFDAGEIADPLRLSMAEAALVQLLDWGEDAIVARLGALTLQLREMLADAGFETPTRPAPHFTGLRPRRVPLDACVRALQDARIICTARHGVLRIAPHLHVDDGDIDSVVRVLRQVK